MVTRKAIGVLALVFAIGLAGCASSTATFGGPGENLRDDVTRSMSSVETYQVDMTVTLQSTAGSESFAMSGTFDRVNEKAKLTYENSDGRTTAYIGDSSFYAQGPEGNWYAQKFSEDPWGGSSGTTWSNQQTILNGSEVQRTGQTMVNGDAAYVLEVNITPREFQQAWAGEQPDASNAPTDSGMDVSYEIYVSKDTSRVLKIEMSATSPTSTDSFEVTMTFSDYDEDVTIEIPEEATYVNETATVSSGSTLPASALVSSSSTPAASGVVAASSTSASGELRVRA